MYDTCRNGHELTPPTVRRDRNGYRICRKCNAAKQRVWKQRAAEALRQKRDRDAEAS